MSVQEKPKVEALDFGTWPRCRYCGQWVRKSPRANKHSGKRYEAGDKYCSTCGRWLKPWEIVRTLKKGGI